MRNFIIIFRGRVGTSPVVRTLDRFPNVSIVRHFNDTGWEPFDRHNCGPMALIDLERCLDHIYSGDHIDMNWLNGIYMKTAKNPLKNLEANKAVGFKMRFVPPDDAMSSADEHAMLYKKIMIEVLKRNQVVVFITIRQDVLRWGLSKYHGDGSGKDGHLQFKLAQGQISRDQIPRIQVDCDRLDVMMQEYESNHRLKRQLMEDFKAAGIQVIALRYEDLLKDKTAYFQSILRNIEIDLSVDAVNAVLSQGLFYEKVHSEHIADFVVNYEEVLKRFGQRYASWP